MIFALHRKIVEKIPLDTCDFYVNDFLDNNLQKKRRDFEVNFQNKWKKKRVKFNSLKMDFLVSRFIQLNSK